ncbi:glycosyltransferase family 2 protein [Streptomyces sp. SS07]|uniref:glycosyltransferase n=1 Tax=Streptomyces sp. SS07 TaxID=2015315 RepID=UPI000B5CB510|nr:glycosyltransferase [Streptomyces sp. SS07]
MNIAAVAVVVPAHNEAEHIVACVRSIRAAADHVAPVPVHTVVVADACTDTTAHLAAREGAHTVSIDRRNAGAARAAGVGHALALLSPTPGIWLAMTDADSTVPAHWLTRQTAWARRGHDAVLGTIRLAPDPRGACTYARSEHDAAYYRTRPAAEDTTDWEHPHIHGANMGVSATAYHHVGGFAPLTSSEDHDLVARLTRAGHRIARTDDHPVLTAGRLHGRAPAGLAALLRSLHPPARRYALTAPPDPVEEHFPPPHACDRSLTTSTGVASCCRCGF